MPDTQEVQGWVGREAQDRDGEKLGKIEDIYLDEQTGKPEWMAIKTGLFGGNLTFVPLAEASSQGDAIRVPYEKSHVKDAPNVVADGALSQDEEAKLYSHFGLDYGENRSDSGLPEGGGAPAPAADTVGHDTSGPTTDDAMTRSEEELRVGTAQRETGRARLRKFITTEQVQTSVPVSREEVRIEREPITDANRGDAYDGPALSEEEHEVVLHAEEPVVQKDVVARERVRMDKDTVTDDVQVSEEVRKEQIEVEGDR